jgi:hypothetical protein
MVKFPLTTRDGVVVNNWSELKSATADKFLYGGALTKRILSSGGTGGALDPQGSTFISNFAGFSTFTPSNSNKIYCTGISVTTQLVDGTYLSLTEGQRIVSVDWSGTHFEAYSAQKFTLILAPVIIDKDNIGASAEQAVTDPVDPKAYSLARHTNVLGFGSLKVIHARCIGPSLWYMKVPLGGLLNKITRPFVKQQNLNYTGSPVEYPVGYLDVNIQAGNTTDIFWKIRGRIAISTAEATPSLVIK